MLGRSLPQGSEAISFHNTLFRVSELCWVKAVRLSIPEWVIRIAALLLGIAWIFAMKNAKSTYMNIEFLMAGFPLILAWTTSGSLKIGCSGDFEEAYDSRKGLMSSVFRGWIDTLTKQQQDWLHLKSSDYDLLLNPNRVAWIRPCVQWKFYPLVVIGAMSLYLYVVGLGFNFETYPVFDDLQILIFNDGLSTIRYLSYAIIGVAAAAFLFSIKRSVEVCGTGGVQDVFALTSADLDAVLNILAGSEKQNTASAKGKAKAITVEASKPKAAPKKPEPKVVKEETVEASKASEKPTAVLSEEAKAAQAGANSQE